MTICKFFYKFWHKRFEVCPDFECGGSEVALLNFFVTKKYLEGILGTLIIKNDNIPGR